LANYAVFLVKRLALADHFFCEIIRHHGAIIGMDEGGPAIDCMRVGFGDAKCFGGLVFLCDIPEYQNDAEDMPAGILNGRR